MTARLVWRHITANKLRSALTVGTLMIAVFLLAFLRSVLVAISSGVEAADARRLVVQSAVSLFVDLPLAYQGKIEAVPGVEHTCKLQWFGGIYREPSNFFAQFAVDPDKLFDVYPTIKVVEGSRETFLRDRTACIIGADLAERFGWEVGQTVPLRGTIFARTDGSSWEFTIAGIYRLEAPGGFDEGTMLFHYSYLEQSIESGLVDNPPGVGVYSLRIADGADVAEVAAQVDALFANGPQRVQTTTEDEFNRQFVSMLGNVPALFASIGGGVLFAIALAALNTMLMAGRERVKSVGVLKALGFSDRTVALLLLAESLVLCGLGGAAGIGLAKGLEPTIATLLSAQFPGFAVTPETIALGLGSALGIGLLAGALPAWNAARLRPVVALKMEQ